ncbi:protein-lysine N-methyltransferase EEF2KMT-like isoform X2 [Halichondria panicea]|uniref:protein-lysine N-methyltransferase EEF2KMT-like isoform X2 n=1 Tax=Halichondria panicea TaxID=6063 RepID=UPI00312B4014
MERLLDQYLAAVPLRDFQWTNVEALTEEVQQKMLDEVVRSPLAVSHSPSPAYQAAFLKKLMAKVEAYEGTIVEGIYELYAQLLSTPTSEQQGYSWRSYHLHNGDYVSLMESPYLISYGTTGLTTWQAALRFVEWVSSPQISTLFHSKRVLELGCGLGLTGLALCKLCSPSSLCFSDTHPRVLHCLRGNVEHNSPSSSGVSTEVVQLDWGSQEDISSFLTSHTLDYIIATALGQPQGILGDRELPCCACGSENALQND